MLSILSVLLAAVVGVVPSPVTVVTVHAKEFSFSAPKTAPAGTITFHLVNDGTMLHHVTVIRLMQGKTVADFMEAMKKSGPPPAWAVDVGGPNAAVPGQTSDATMTLEPGQYVLACFIPSPGDPAPHLMKGMVKGLTVVPSSGARAEPVADVNVRLSNYKFTMSKPLTVGHHVIRVTNDAEQPHEIVVVKLPPGKTVAALAQWVEDGMNGQPPAMPLGGISPLQKGRSATFPLELTPGRYGMICFLPDMKDGKSHSMHGMTTEFTVQ